MTQKSEERLFVSYAGRDRAWATWVAWQLEVRGYSVELDIWDWPAGVNFVVQMNKALASCDRVVALWSPAYFDETRFTTEEWTAVVAARERCVPLRIEPFEPPAILKPILCRDLFGLTEEGARRTLLEAIEGPGRPTKAPGYPGAGATSGLDSGPPPFPGELQRVSNLPHRSIIFTGRAELLARLRASLTVGHTTTVFALHGMGGVGKTHLAIEYAHRFADNYDLTWWINAEDPTRIGEQLAYLAVVVGVAKPETEISVAVTKIRAYLEMRNRWLIVFDNVHAARDVSPWLPSGLGHTIITSRGQGWTGVAGSVAVDVLDRIDSIALLRSQVAELSQEAADGLADLLGDLPLALVQAAGVMAETGMTRPEYVDAFMNTTASVLAEGTPVGYPASLAASVQVSMRELSATQPAAGDLVQLCGLLSPDPIPLWMFVAKAGQSLPEAVAADMFALRLSVGHAARYGLVQAATSDLTMHRLTQAVIRESLSSVTLREVRRRSERLLVAAGPADPMDPAQWPTWALLLPHIVKAAENPDSTSEIRSLACTAAWYLIKRGQHDVALTHARTWYQKWSEMYGQDDHETLFAAFVLGEAYGAIGEYETAYRLDMETLERYRRVLGLDHPRTLFAANNLSGDLHRLGRYEEARRMAEDTLARRRRTLGEDHQETLRSAGNLAAFLCNLRRYEEARHLYQDALARSRRVLGEDHPDTLMCASGLSLALSILGRHKDARRLGDDTLARARRVLGEDHSSTLVVAHLRAHALQGEGKYEEAHHLREITFARSRRILGEDHPHTLRVAAGLAKDLRLLGRHKEASKLEEDLRRRGGDVSRA